MSKAKTLVKAIDDVLVTIVEKHPNTKPSIDTARGLIVDLYTTLDDDYDEEFWVDADPYFDDVHYDTDIFDD